MSKAMFTDQIRDLIKEWGSVQDCDYSLCFKFLCSVREALNSIQYNERPDCDDITNHPQMGEFMALMREIAKV